MSHNPQKRYTAIVICILATFGIIVTLTYLSGDNNTKKNAPLRFAYQNRIGSAACIVAVEGGYFEREGLEVEAFRFNSGPACAEAIYSGSADIGTMGDTTAIITVSRDDRFVIIGSHGQGEHRHRMVVQADSPIRTVEALRGKTLGVKKGTSTYGGLLLLLAEKQVDPSEIRIIDMKPNEMPDALAAGSIDAFVASEPTPSLAEQRGAHELTTLGGLGNNYPILILARRDLLVERPEQVTQFLRALRKAGHAIQADPNDTAQTLASMAGLPPEVTLNAMNRHTYNLTLAPSIFESLTQTAVFLQTQGTITTVPDLSQATNPKLLELIIND